jgi:ABC-type antimicrobial peptide transport system permease subunit
MDIRDIFGLSIRQLKEKRTRTALTILMVVIGVASIVALTSQIAGASKSIQTSLAALGPTSIIITPSSGTAFTAADVANLETLPNVSSVTPVLTGSATLTVNRNTTTVTVIGISTQGLGTLLGGDVNLYEGSLYTDTVTPLAVIGHSIAFSSSTDTNLQTAAVGETATLSVSSSTRGASASKVSIPIEGILQTYSASIVPVDSGVIVSMPFAEVLLHKTSFNEILVKANNVKNVTSLSALITTIYGTRARVLNTEQLASTASSIIGEITLLFTIIGGISLVVAAIGIMNVMLMAVSERVHDIGILKSIGFRNKDVLLIFLLQALIIGMLGGVVGLGVGIGTSYSLSALISAGSATGPSATAASGAPVGPAPSGGAVVVSSSGGGFSGGGAAGGRSFGGAGGASTASRSASSTSSFSSSGPVFTPLIMMEAISVAIAISAIAGIYPAWKASKMEPIDALRML